MGGRFRVDNSLFVGYPESARVGVGRAAVVGVEPEAVVDVDQRRSVRRNVEINGNLETRGRSPGARP